MVCEARAEAERRRAVIDGDHGRAGRGQRADRLEAVDEADVEHDRGRQQRARQAAAERIAARARHRGPGASPAEEMWDECPTSSKACTRTRTLPRASAGAAMRALAAPP